MFCIMINREEFMNLIPSVSDLNQRKVWSIEIKYSTE